MPVPIWVPNSEESNVPGAKSSSMRAKLYLVKSQDSIFPSSRRMASLGQRGLAHSLDIALVYGCSAYTAKVLTLAAIMPFLHSIKLLGSGSTPFLLDLVMFGEEKIFFLTFMFVQFGYFVLLPMWRGKTLGMGALGLRIVSSGGPRLKLPDLTARFSWYLVNLFLLGLPLLWSVRRPDKKLWHDVQSETSVIKTR